MMMMMALATTTVCSTPEKYPSRMTRKCEEVLKTHFFIRTSLTAEVFLDHILRFF
jgi:hypothetical protein